MGVSTACAIAKRGRLSCWSVYAGVSPLPSTSGKFLQVQVNQGDICGLTLSWTIKCWWPANRRQRRRLGDSRYARQIRDAWSRGA